MASSENFNKLVKAYKFANHGVPHPSVQSIVKAWYDPKKKDTNLHALINEKCAEWKRNGSKEGQINPLLLIFWDRM